MTTRLHTIAPAGYMREGWGTRRDCGRYDACLSAFLSAHKKGNVDPRGHCPSACPGYVAPVKLRAVDYASSGRPVDESSMYAGWK